MKKLVWIAGLASVAALWAALGWEGPQSQSIATVASKEAAPPPRDTVMEQFSAALTAYIEEKRIAEPLPGLALAVVKEGKLGYEKVWGVRDVTTGAPLDAHSVFRLASLSKCFAPILAATLIEEGKLSWDDKVAAYVPDFRLRDKKAGQNLSLRQVLSHTTGLPRHTYSNLLNAGIPYPEIRRRLREVTLSHPLGSTYNYQNAAYNLSADMIAAAGQAAYDSLMQVRVFDPLGMKDASVGYEPMLRSSNAAQPHNPVENGFARIEIEPNYYETPAAAGVNASLRDMEKWLQFLMRKKPGIISDSLRREIFTPAVEVSTAEKNFYGWEHLDRAWYALGWRVLEWKGRTLIYHGGMVNGYRTEIAFDPVERIGYVLLANGFANFLGKATEDIFQLWDVAQPVMPVDSSGAGENFN